MTRELAPCGTFGAATRHQRRGEPMCDPCTKAYADYHREYDRAYEWKGTSKGRPRTTTCGTAAGRRYHQRHGQPVCAACREADRASRRAV